MISNPKSHECPVKSYADGRACHADMLIGLFRRAKNNAKQVERKLNAWTSRVTQYGFISTGETGDDYSFPSAMTDDGSNTSSGEPLNRTGKGIHPSHG